MFQILPGHGIFMRLVVNHTINFDGVFVQKRVQSRQNQQSSDIYFVFISTLCILYRVDWDEINEMYDQGESARRTVRIVPTLAYKLNSIVEIESQETAKFPNFQTDLEIVSVDAR